MRSQSAIKFAAVILVIAALAYVAIYGIDFGFNVFGEFRGIPKATDAVRLGLDLKGGVYIVYEADTDKQVTREDMDSATEVIRRRLDAKRYFDATVTPDIANRRLIVEIPSVMDGEQAVKEIGQVARLTFREPDDEGQPTPEGNIVLEGTDVKSAKALYGVVRSGGNPENYVVLEMKDEGARKFADATGRLIGKPIAIYLDDELQSAPIVQDKITDGIATITGDFTAKTAGNLAALIRSGALPFSLKPVQVTEIGPTLGQRAFDISIMVGAIAIVFVMIFMLVFYRLPGVIANIALIAYTVLTVLVMAALGITITLPGIAGIILSVGMAVDANIIIFERLKEEMRAGKTLKAAIDYGFTRAFTAILDGNLTTVIAGLVLLWLGTGPIQGFAWTLVIGVIISMFTAITLTKFLLVQFVNFKPDFSKHLWLYGAAFKGGKAS